MGAVVETLPETSFLQAYKLRKAYTDCYALDVPMTVTPAEFIHAFYTTWLFKQERLILTTLVAKPSSDADAAELAAGRRNRFAAWTVEARAPDQILMRDYLSKTRSWLMCAPREGGGTRLYFGSAIVPERILPNGRVDLGLGFHLLLPFHRLYSVALISAAANRLRRRAVTG